MSDLSDLFKLVAEEKRKKKEEIDSLIGDSFDKLFVEQLKSHKTPEELAKKHNVPVSKIKDQLKKGTKVEKEHTNDSELASVIASQHLDELPDYYDRLAKIEKTQKDNTKDPVSSLEKELVSLKDISYSSIDKLMRTICDVFDISPRKLHDDFVKKHKMIPDEWIKNKRGLKEEVKNNLIERSLGLLAEPSQTKNSDPLTPLDQNFTSFEDLQKHYKLFLNRVQQQLSTLGGGGETNLTYMDVPITSVTTSSYTIKAQDYYIGVNYAGAVTITLPRADREGKVFVVKDELGEASKGTNRYITILPTGSDLIDGRDRAILAFDYGSLTFIWKSNSWRVV
jgi:hypothetical protein